MIIYSARFGKALFVAMLMAMAVAGTHYLVDDDVMIAEMDRVMPPGGK